MTVVTLTYARTNLSRLVDTVTRTGARVTLTRGGKPVALLMSAADSAALQETLDTLADPELMEGIREGVADLAAGRTFTPEEVEAELRRVGRR